jgi:rRNA maturation endonuclease Nob1
MIQLFMESEDSMASNPNNMRWVCAKCGKGKPAVNGVVPSGVCVSCGHHAVKLQF